MPLFDTHAHYNDDAFDQNRKGLLDALPDAGVGAVVIPGVDVESSRSALALAESRPWLFAAAGIHPEDCAGCTAADFSAIRDLCREKKVVAIGEIGLDYYWAVGPQQHQQQPAHHGGRQHQGQGQHHIQHALHQPGQLGDVVRRQDPQEEYRHRGDGGDPQ